MILHLDINDCTPERVRELRIAIFGAEGKTNLQMQQECAETFGMECRSWQKKEQPVHTKSYRQLTLGEFNYLLLLANQHPYYQITPKVQSVKVVLDDCTPERVRELRIAIFGAEGKTNLQMQQECAETFGMECRSWQKKEQPVHTNSYRKLTLGEFNYLLLLANQHPSFNLEQKI